MAKKFSPAISQELAWALASAAYRINGGYVKFPENKEQKKNTELVYDLLKDTTNSVTQEDREQGQLVRNYISKTATVASLRGTIDEWGQLMARVSQLEIVDNTLDLNVIASMPQTYARYLQREKVHERLSATQDHAQLTVHDKVEIEAEVIENKFSSKWQCNYITVIDTDNRAWYFAYRESLQKGKHITLRGTVKRIEDRLVQLNRVKILNKEEV